MREGERKKTKKPGDKKPLQLCSLLPDGGGGSCPIGVGNCSPMAVASQARQVGRLLPDVAKILSGGGLQEQEETGNGGIPPKPFGC